MKSILMSIKPKYCELIAAGKKTIEVRKTKPRIETPFKCYIYQPKTVYVSKNKANEFLKPIQDKRFGKVIAEFVCDKIYQYTTCDVKNGVDISDEDMTRLSCLTKDEIRNYELSPGRFGVFGWHILDLVIYDEPKELHEFKKNKHKCWYADLGIAKRDCKECKNADCFFTRPPQSWCYVEE